MRRALGNRIAMEEKPSRDEKRGHHGQIVVAIA